MSEAIFDTSFFEDGNITEYNSWHELGNLVQVSGLMNHYQSIIEIRVNNKQKRKILFKDLSNEGVLFPLYQTKFSETDCSTKHPNCLLIVEKEIGTVATYEFDSDKFLMDKLHFTLRTVTIKPEMKYVILSSIEYEGKKLVKRKTDTLVKERFVII